MAERCDERDRVEDFLAISFTYTPLVKRAKTGNDFQNKSCFLRRSRQTSVNNSLKAAWARRERYPRNDIFRPRQSASDCSFKQ